MKRLRLLITICALLISTFLYAEVVSGTCGKNLTWTFNSETGLLKIEGSGEMYDYDYFSPLVPWYSYRERILAVELPKGLTNIGRYAFEYCTGLTSISIPTSVTSIGDYAFDGCSGLTFISIPNSVTSIGDLAFTRCSGLTDPIIVNDIFVLLPQNFRGEYSISSNIKKIIGGAFEGCSGLTSIFIPNSVTSIGRRAFYGCSGLTSVSIPNSLTSIGESVFYNCKGLTSVSTPNSVTCIGGEAFYGCSSLATISIPNSVTNIGYGAFENCSRLYSISIPSSVTSIRDEAFSGCNNINKLSINSSANPKISCEELYVGDDVTVVQNNYNSGKLRKVVLGKKVAQIRAEAFSEAYYIQEFTITGEEPPYCYPNIFGTKDLSNAKLYVPADKVTYYQTTEPWSKFGTVKTLSGETPSTPTACAKPTIAYENGQLVFNSATTGAKYHCTITSPDMKSDVLNESGTMNLDARYDIAVYATAEGYTQSETATATLYWVKADGSLTDNINAAKMRGVVVTADKGFVSVSGLNDGEQVLFYATDGKMLGSQKAVNGTASLSTSESVVICKVGTTSLKVLVK